MIPGSLEHSRSDPIDCANWLSLNADMWSTSVSVVSSDSSVTIFEVEFEPIAKLKGYPTEIVRITITEAGDIFTVPIGPDNRKWEHRYPAVPLKDIRNNRGVYDLHNLLAALCLWYPKDPEHLRWSWRLGLDGYLRIVQRHLWSEEYFRRKGPWPGEDAPHGEPENGVRHPIMSPSLRKTA